MHMFRGCYTAIVTPMRDSSIDYDGFQRLVEFQVKSGASGLIVAGTTGESPTLTWAEHMKVIEKALEHTSDKFQVVAGTGSNSTEEALEATKQSWDLGAKAALLVDPYYNGPSSLEIRKEYVEPIARALPDMQMIPYVIPGRTGTQLMPHDLAILHKTCSNLNAVKEATGDYENARLTRKYCGDQFDILSGDDDRTYEMMTNDIKASGVVSVTSNIAPRAVQEMCKAISAGDIEKAGTLANALKPLFQIVTVKSEETTQYGTVSCKARNPLPYKTLMNIMGLPSGPCRPPVGRMTSKGLNIVLKSIRLVHERTPEILNPIQEFFDIDLEKRLSDDEAWRHLCYDDY